MYRKDEDTGMFPSTASTNLHLSCSCDGCAGHDFTCSVELKPSTTCSGDGVAGDGVGGQSDGNETNENRPRMFAASRNGNAIGRNETLSVPRGVPNRLVSLGRDGSGNYSGHFEIDPVQFLAASESGIAGLRIAGGETTGLDVVLDSSNAIRQVMAAECFVSVDVIDDGRFALSFYQPSAVEPEVDTNGFYVLQTNASPYVRHIVGPVSSDSSSRSLPVVEKRPGSPDSTVTLVMRRQAEGAVFWGISREGGLREDGLEILADGRRRSVVRGADGYERKTERLYAVSGGARRMVEAIEGDGAESRITRYEYFGDGSVSVRADNSGLRTEYGYDGENRRILVREIAAGRIREKRLSYAPLGVRPHDS